MLNAEEKEYAVRAGAGRGCAMGVCDKEFNLVQGLGKTSVGHQTMARDRVAVTEAATGLCITFKRRTIFTFLCS